LSNLVQFSLGTARGSRRSVHRVKLTTARIDALPRPAKGVSYTYDSQQPNLAVGVTPRGTKTFVAAYKLVGSAKRHFLGRYPALGPDEARRAAAEVAGEVARGQDPAAARRLKRTAKRTVADLWSVYEPHIRQKNRAWERDRRRWLAHIEPALGRKALVDVTRADCQKVVDTAAKGGPVAGNRTAALLGALMAFAVLREEIATSPARRLVRAPEKSRARILSSEEAPRLIAAIEAEPEPWRGEFLLGLFTGQRRGAVSRMKWSDVDRARRVWMLPSEDAKNGQATPVPLTQPALELLQRRYESRDTSGWVFASTRGSGPAISVAKPWARVCKAAHLVDFRLHDIRRSVGTALARVGLSPHQIATGLGHKTIASARAYVRLVGEDVREGMDAAVASLTAPATKP
jgi:integrase